MKKKKRKSGVREKSARQKVATLEKAISDIEAKLSLAKGREAWGLEQQLRIYREELRVQKIHVISKLSSVPHFVVDGSYGSNN